MTLSGIQNFSRDLDEGTQRSALLDGARSLISLRDELVSEENRITENRLKLARQYMKPESGGQMLEEEDE